MGIFTFIIVIGFISLICDSFNCFSIFYMCMGDLLSTSLIYFLIKFYSIQSLLIVVYILNLKI